MGDLQFPIYSKHTKIKVKKKKKIPTKKRKKKRKENLNRETAKVERDHKSWRLEAGGGAFSCLSFHGPIQSLLLLVLGVVFCFVFLGGGGGGGWRI